MVSAKSTLEDWFRASGTRFDYEVIEMAEDKEFINIAYARSTISDWKKSGIPNREDAVIIIKALRACGEKYGQPLFDDKNIILHATMFMMSKACSQEFAPLKMTEMMEICGQDANISIAHFHDAPQLAELSQQINPAPPLYLFGRDDDITTVISRFDSNPICVIDGVGGDGKTALAWHSAVRAIANKKFQKLAWVTDKRYFIDATGTVQTIVDEIDHDDFMEKICMSMVSAFQWIPLMGARGDNLISACVDKLRQEQHLLVVDNFETVESNQEIISRLLNMFTASTSTNPIESRVLITTRERYDHPNCNRVALSGLGEDGSHQYIEHLQATWAIRQRLQPSQIDTLAQTAIGNPLLLQIAMQHYSIAPSKRTFDKIIASIEGGNMDVIEHIFSPLLERLAPEIVTYAIRLSKEFIYSQHEVKPEHLEAIWHEVYQGDDMQYNHALQTLVQHRILNWSGSGRYTMHAIIRSYLLYISQNNDTDTTVS